MCGKRRIWKIVKTNRKNSPGLVGQWGFFVKFGQKDKKKKSKSQGKLIKKARKVGQQVNESWSKSQGKLIKKSRKVGQNVKESWSKSQGKLVKKLRKVGQKSRKAGQKVKGFWLVGLGHLGFGFTGLCAQGVLDPIIILRPMSLNCDGLLWLNNLLIYAFLGTSAHDSLPLAGYPLATCRIPVVRRGSKK